MVGRDVAASRGIRLELQSSALGGARGFGPGA